MQLRLASTSPRRSALLQQIGVSFVAERQSCGRTNKSIIDT